MKKRVLSIVLALCLCMTVIPEVRAEEAVPSPQEVYEILIAFRDRDGYKEGTVWTNETHPNYKWNGGTAGGIANIGAGCVAFAYQLSDAAFGNLPARMYSSVKLSEVKPGDILRVNGGAHTVIVLQVNDAGVVVAEGNLSGKVHWGRGMSKAEVEAASHYITRYPEGYVPPDDPSAGEPLGTGTVDGLTWMLAKTGTLTISGNGAMPDISSGEAWSAYASQILQIVIQNGVTSIGTGAFQGSAAIGAEIPASVKTIGGSAFRNCSNLASVKISEGVESIGENAFRGCGQLQSITIPASVGSVGSAAFMECQELTQAVFASGSKTVAMGDNLFTKCYKLAKVTLPSRIDRVGAGMFMNCLLLSQVVISQGAESIGESAFASCGVLQSVTIPDSVTRIETAAFASCLRLTDIYFGGSETQWQIITKLGDSNTTLASKTIHYNSAIPDPDPGTDPDPDPGPEPGPDPDPGPGPGPGHTHAWDSGAVTTPAGCTSSGVRTYTCSVCGDTRTEDIPAQGHDFVQDASGDYHCRNELNASGVPTLVVSAAVKEGYEAVTFEEKVTASTACQTEESARQYASKIVENALLSISGSLQYEVHTVSYTPPTRTVDGEYVYQVTIQPAGRAAAGGLTTEPLYIVLPATGGTEPDPDPTPTPPPAARPEPAPDTGGEETYLISIPQFSGGKVVSSPRYAAQGGRVTLTVYPEEGYTLSGLTVASAQGRDVSLRELEDGRFSFTMPGGRVEVNAVFEASDTGDGEAGPGPGASDTGLDPLPFMDVAPAAWYYGSVDYVWKHSLMSGVSDTKFAPGETTSRAMIWTILARMHAVNTDAAPGGVWYEKGMAWAVEQGVTDGTDPMGSVTREQLAAMLWRDAGSPSGDGSLDGFSDAASVSGYAAAAVRWAVGRGILQGTGGRLEPNGTASRAEVAAMVMRYTSGA